MDQSDQSPLMGGRAAYAFALRFTPAEWRRLLADADFLRDPDNSYRPRRLMGVPVQIVPDHAAA
jgi:hypothetical protein